MTPALVQELRREFDDLIDALDAEGVCTSRECMCDTSASIVKMNATITKLEQKFSFPADEPYVSTAVAKMQEHGI